MKVSIVDGALTRELRRSVLRPDVAADAQVPGDDLPTAVHFAALTDDGQALSTCFIYPDPCPWRDPHEPAWHLRQMATSPQQRTTGLGGAVLTSVIAYVITEGATVLWCNAREGAIEFYRRAGFLGVGEIFTDEVHTIPHLRMWRPVHVG
jgi:predicted GNAT family N-acyltransferase